MKLEEWTAAVTAELQKAGFDVSECQGFPLVKRPEAFPEIVRLLKFQTSLSCMRRIYAEGMLFVPAGVRELP